jgi:energy-converting hydrogenase Eha subunit E
VRRVIRRVDLWSVLKLSLILFTCLYLAFLGAIAAIWGLAYSTGTVKKLQSFLADVGLANFHFYGDQMFRACAAIGAILVLAGTIITVVATALINLISEVTGGIRVIVIEEDPLPLRGRRVGPAPVPGPRPSTGGDARRPTDGPVIG